MPSQAPIWTGPTRRLHRSTTILRTTGCEVRVAWVCRAEDRSFMPDRPSSR